MEESGELVECERKMLLVIESEALGVRTGKILEEGREASCLEALNSLIRKHRVNVLKSGDGELIYRALTEEEIEKAKKMTSTEMAVYEILEECGDKGCIPLVIKTKLQTTAPKINGVLRSLQNKGLIKCIKSIQGNRKKIWMIADIEPSTLVSGSIFYTNGQFDHSVVEALTHTVFNYIKTRPLATTHEIAVFCRSRKMDEHTIITEENVQSTLNSLLYDAKIEIVNNGESNGELEITKEGKLGINNQTYRIAQTYNPEIGYLKSPCAYCPLFRECKHDGIISPLNCIYAKLWMNS